METFYIIVGIVILTIVVRAFMSSGVSGGREKKQYKYKRKNFFLTRAEHECYDALIKGVGQDYYIFAQVHLSSILDHTTKGQNWRAAQAHINRKSVDFLLCDKAHISPKLAIELDDRSHERADRVERDGVVERILSEAEIPLLRLKNQGQFDPKDLSMKIQKALSGIK